MEQPPPEEKEIAVTEETEIEQEEWVGPLPTEATDHQAKKRKILHHEKLFLDK